VLIIREQQMRALQAAQAAEREAPLLDWLAREYPDDWARLGEGGARALVRETIRSGVRRRITSEASLIGLLRLHVELGPGLERAPQRAWALDVLDHPTLPGALKVNLVRQRVSALTQGRRVVSHEDEA
jgi:hypothetical protein